MTLTITFAGACAFVPGPLVPGPQTGAAGGATVHDSLSVLLPHAPGYQVIAGQLLEPHTACIRFDRAQWNALDAKGGPLPVYKFGNHRFLFLGREEVSLSGLASSPVTFDGGVLAPSNGDVRSDCFDAQPPQQMGARWRFQAGRFQPQHTVGPWTLDGVDYNKLALSVRVDVDGAVQGTALQAQPFGSHDVLWRLEMRSDDATLEVFNAEWRNIVTPTCDGLPAEDPDYLLLQTLAAAPVAVYPRPNGPGPGGRCRCMVCKYPAASRA